jgi:hypothetical protein
MKLITNFKYIILLVLKELNYVNFGLEKIKSFSEFYNIRFLWVKLYVAEYGAAE